MIEPTHLLGYLQNEQIIRRRRRHLHLVEVVEPGSDATPEWGATPDAA